ncbi:hypothetical protein [Cohnella sp. JJ-181]|uniref:hypothetical protein n=1 Tax=Cohnella rhizoplanae TaxID=2974897 RepID=UPI0022FF636A|nr:hypothetical protein [Cohnella sp. JJ-181]CAI6084043.1 hypothetical protein COHCIP112018_04207 [Cohnella sp. JJ-181]
MQAMTRLAVAVLMLAAMLSAAGCVLKNTLVGGIGGDCFAETEWVDFLMLNDIMYTSNPDGTKEVVDGWRGEKVGEVSYMLDEHACTKHKTKNGDAAYLPIGTPIYAMNGYKPSYRVMAGGKVYEADRNPNAKTIGDLWDIDGKIAKVSLESGMDGSPIGDFTPEASAIFARDLPQLKLVGFDTIYKDNKPEYGILLRVHLQDGTSFRMVFYENANSFTAGVYGTEAMKTVVVSERTRIKKAAGLM